MAMILDFFVKICLQKLSGFVEGELCKVLGVKEEITKLERRLERIRGFLRDAELRRHKDANMDAWVRELKDVMYDADDIIDLCIIRGGRLLESQRPSASVVSSLISYPKSVTYRHKISGRIKAVSDRLKEIADDNSVILERVSIREDNIIHRVKSHQTSSIEVRTDIVGAQIEDDAQNLITLIMKSTTDETKGLVLGIVGMGGIGKTTLARNIFNDERIKQNYDSLRIWLHVSKTYSDSDVLKEMIRGAGGSAGGAESRAELEPKLVSLFSKNLFMVLDDVWNPDIWEVLLKNPVISGAASSRIVIITTRDENVARHMGAHIHHVKKMDEKTGWELLRKTVLENKKEDDISRFEKVGIEIARKCDGLPLAIKVIGGILRSKTMSLAEWDKVLRSDSWSMKQIDEKLPGALYLSYEDLPSDLKQCFLYCCLYPEKGDMYSKDLVRCWVAEGFIVEQGELSVEEVAEDYYRELIWRNLLQVDPMFVDMSRCTMHDLFRSLAQSLIEGESIYVCNSQSISTSQLTKLRRLSMSKAGERIVLPDITMKQKCLRSLIIFDSPNIRTIEDGVFEKLRSLRVLVLNDTSIERLPNFIGKLLHLRHLDLDRTKISEIPESVGCLQNLQTLSISGCKSMSTLPKTTTKLYNLRCLRLNDTPLTSLPEGMGSLTNLNELDAFIIDHYDDLKELQRLAKLRSLTIYRLDRAITGDPAALANKPSLKKLYLFWARPGDDDNGAQCTEEQIQRAEVVYGQLSPPSSLQYLSIECFPGRRFPSWITSTSLGVSCPGLSYLSLHDLPSCTKLPPLGLLPELKFLSIRGAGAVITIGDEFLGGLQGPGAFPKLEVMRLLNMPNWEEWLTSVEEPEYLDGLMDMSVPAGPDEEGSLPYPRPPRSDLDLVEEWLTSVEEPEYLDGLMDMSVPAGPDEEGSLPYPRQPRSDLDLVGGYGVRRSDNPDQLPCPSRPDHVTLKKKMQPLFISSTRPPMPPQFISTTRRHEEGSLPYPRQPRSDSDLVGGYRVRRFTNPDQLPSASRPDNVTVNSATAEPSSGRRRRRLKRTTSKFELFPNLKELWLVDCPKLRALPHMPKLESFHVESTHSLERLQNLVLRTDRLIVRNNHGLWNIFSAELKYLQVDDCPSLRYVTLLFGSLQHVVLSCPPSSQCLPPWLSCLVEVHTELRKLEVQCSLPLLKSCLMGEANWEMIQQIPEVRIWTPDDSAFILYNKDPPMYQTNVDSA